VSSGVGRHRRRAVHPDGVEGGKVNMLLAASHTGQDVATGSAIGWAIIIVIILILLSQKRG
jgi:hypothetical protein